VPEDMERSRSTRLPSISTLLRGFDFWGLVTAGGRPEGQIAPVVRDSPTALVFGDALNQPVSTDDGE
jgi:hypothetical protein